MLSKLIAALQDAALEMTAEEIADMLWLALQMDFVAEPPSIESDVDISDDTRPDDTQGSEDQFPQKTPPPSSTDIHMNPRYSDNDSISHLTGLPFRSPAASALPDTLSLARALRPFMRRLSSKTTFVFNENATVQTIAEAPNTVWLPILDPAPVRWFDIALVIDEGASMALWKDTIAELRTLLEHLGAFRDVRIWRLATDDRESVQLYADTGFAKEQSFAHNPKELIDPGGRRLILVVTDCVSLAWHSGEVQQVLDIWGKKNLVTLIQMLPRRLWYQTALDFANTVQIGVSLQEIANASLKTLQPFQWFDEDTSFEATFPVPVVTLEPRSLLSWSHIVTGSGGTWITGKIFEKNLDETSYNRPLIQDEPILSARKRVQLFHANASQTARRLAGLLAAAPVPVSLQVIRLIRQTMLPQARQVHIAEVLLSGLLEEIYRDETATDPDYDVEYDFIAGIRDELLNAVPIPDGQRVLREISTFIGQRYGQTHDFLALVTTQERSKQNVIVTGESRLFAQITATVLRRFGGDFASLAENLEIQVKLLEDQASDHQIETRETRTTLESSQTYSYTTTQEPITSDKAFLSKIWCDLNWTEWISFDSADIKTLPTGSGVYRIRAVGGNELFFIGHTGRNLRERIGDLIRNTMRDPSQMPFNDPHTAAPSLWAWRDATGISFECSATPLTDTFSDEERKALVHYLLWQYRLELGKSTLCNYGRIHPHYVKSRNRSTGHRGYRLSEGQLNTAENPSFPPLRLAATSHEKTWMGLEWSDLYRLDTTTNRQDIISSPGVYKILDADTKWLLFIGYSANLRTIFQTQARKNWLCVHPSFAFSVFPDGLHSHQVAEIESDLIGGYYTQTKISPKFQFKNYQDKADGIQSKAALIEYPKSIDTFITGSHGHTAKPIENNINISETRVIDIAHWLKGRKNSGRRTVLFLGARAGGLFRSKVFYSTIQYFSVPTFNNMSRIEQFGECYRVLDKEEFSKSDIHAILTASLQGLIPSEADLRLAEIVKAGMFDAIISTNIDGLLNKAFTETGMKDTQDFQVFTPQQGLIEDILFPRQKIPCLLLKVFGDLAMGEYSLFRNVFYLDTYERLKTFLSSELKNDVLMLGYDPFWDRAMQATFLSEGQELWYVNEGPMESSIMPILQKRKSKYIIGSEGNYEQFMQILYGYLGEVKDTSHILSIKEKIQRKRIFIGYSQKDKEYFQQLQTHLARYEREKLMDVWDDTKIAAGVKWQEEIKKTLDVTKVAILLISPDFMASDFMTKNTLSLLLQSAEKDGAIILPIFLKYCVIKDTYLQQFQPFNNQITAQKNNDREQVWSDLARYVVTLAKND